MECSLLSLTRMCSKMTCERISSLACIVAEVTLKRFFPCVQFNVAEEVTFLSKRCPTLITLEWAFTFKKDKKEISDHWQMMKPMHRLDAHGKNSHFRQSVFIGVSWELYFQANIRLPYENFPPEEKKHPLTLHSYFRYHLVLNQSNKTKIRVALEELSGCKFLHYLALL